MNPEEFNQIYVQYFYYILAGGVLIGLFFGAIPLMLGRRRNKKNLGMIGFISSGVAGGFSPVLGLIVSAVFIVLVLRSPRQKPTDVVVVNQEPIDVTVRDDQ